MSCLESVASVQLHLVAAQLNGFKSHPHTVNTCLFHSLFSVMCFAFLCFLLISQLKLAPSIVLSSYLVFGRVRKLCPSLPVDEGEVLFLVTESPQRETHQRSQSVSTTGQWGVPPILNKQTNTASREEVSCSYILRDLHWGAMYASLSCMPSRFPLFPNSSCAIGGRGFQWELEPSAFDLGAMLSGAEIRKKPLTLLCSQRKKH